MVVVVSVGCCWLLIDVDVVGSVGRCWFLVDCRWWALLVVGLVVGFVVDSLFSALMEQKKKDK